MFSSAVRCSPSNRNLPPPKSPTRSHRVLLSQALPQQVLRLLQQQNFDSGVSSNRYNPTKFLLVTLIFVFKYFASLTLNLTFGMGPQARSLCWVPGQDAYLSQGCYPCTTTVKKPACKNLNRPFARSGHMVQNKLCWDTGYNYTLGL